ncbi:hypothetical protein GWI33_022747 [Rhynchophorus ferrugineus]|uniref:Pre-C2HC domain-containing protein n=1 Tax=Rhynchophorus ferrugineus TaxID=354439 RepID=A0A834MHL8_RHYFE|nr:hypothetical protein GWI33_022747 [Rhynchophorus ferrugineus]
METSTSGVSHIAVLNVENTTRTQNEQALYNAWMNEKSARESLEIALTNMQNSPIVTYETDEEELQKEVGWLTVKNKKRKANNSPGSSPQQIKIKQNNEQNKEIRMLRPAPIIESNVTDFDFVYETLRSNYIIFKATVLNNGQIKLNAECRTTFTKIINCLELLKLQWHSYEDKQTRDIKVMARGLPSTAKSEKIIAELNQYGLKCLNAANIKKKTKNNKGEILVHKKPLPLFMLAFEHDTDTKTIFGIKRILGVEIKIEPLKKSNLISQCKRC